MFGSVIVGKEYSRVEFAIIEITSKPEVKTGGLGFYSEFMIEVMIRFEMGTTVMRNVYIAESDPSERVTSIMKDPTWVVGPIVKV